MVHSQVVNHPALKAVKLSYRYPDGTQALSAISLEVLAGQSLAIIGPNGAGKSTLLLCLAGILPCAGRVLIKGEQWTPKSAKKLRRKIALVFQDPDDQLFMPSLFEDVAFGPLNLGLSKSEIEQRAEKVLKQLNLWEKKDRPPHHLSLGEKKRAALATALVLESEILLLDEPTSNLDPATRGEFMDYLTGISPTKILATHDLDLAKSLCSECVLISAGRQVVSGPIEEILSDRSLLQKHRLIG